jgi:hypothetical protein
MKAKKCQKPGNGASAEMDYQNTLTPCTLKEAFPALTTNIFGIVIVVSNLSSLSK